MPRPTPSISLGLGSGVELEDVLATLSVLFPLSVVVLDAMVDMALVSSAGVAMVAIVVMYKRWVA